MASAVLEPLVCTKCGASLPAEEGQRVLVCPYCGQSHAFTPPPLEPGPAGARAAPNPKLAQTMAIAVIAVFLCAGVAAGVLHSRTPSKTDALAAADPAAADPTTHGPGDPKAVYAKGQNVDIHWGSSWWPGSVLEIDGNKYRAHYEGYGSGSDEWVLADRLRPRAADDFQALFAADAAADADAAPKTDAASATNAADPNATYSAGDAVDILWNSSWWAGRIKTKDGKRYRIGYDGYGTQWDEWVTAERLRPRTKR